MYFWKNNQAFTIKIQRFYLMPSHLIEPSFVGFLHLKIKYIPSYCYFLPATYPLNSCINLLLVAWLFPSTADHQETHEATAQNVWFANNQAQAITHYNPGCRWIAALICLNRNATHGT